MQIYLAKTAGFCFGVDRAVSLVEQAIRDGKHAVTLGPIIHNRHVVERFAKLGVREIASPDEAQPGETVILRAHGVEKAMQEALAARGLEVVDATCPFVEKIHKIVQRAEREGRRCLIIGTPEHPEVRAIASFCTDPVILQTADELRQWLEFDDDRRDLPLAMVCQTTGTQKNWDSCREIAKKNLYKSRNL